jgi:hypothetical protein
MSAPRRRLTVLIAAAALGLGLLLGWLLFHDGGSKPAVASSAAQPASGPAGSTHVSFGQFGVSLALPHDWTSDIRKGVLNLASPDQTVSVTLSMAPGRPDVHLLGRSDRLQLERLFHARVVSRTRSKVGTEPVLISDLRGKTAKGRPVRILSTGLTTRWRTYSIQTFTTPQPPPARAQEFDQLMSTLRFRAPR